MYCSFTKNHPGQNGEKKEAFYFATVNKNKYNVSIANMVFKKGTRNFTKALFAAFVSEFSFSVCSEFKKK